MGGRSPGKGTLSILARIPPEEEREREEAFDVNGGINSLLDLPRFASTERQRLRYVRKRIQRRRTQNRRTKRPDGLILTLAGDWVTGSIVRGLHCIAGTITDQDLSAGSALECW